MVTGLEKTLKMIIKKIETIVSKLWLNLGIICDNVSSGVDAHMIEVLSFPADNVIRIGSLAMIVVTA